MCDGRRPTASRPTDKKRSCNEADARKRQAGVASRPHERDSPPRAVRSGANESSIRSRQRRDGQTRFMRPHREPTSPRLNLLLRGPSPIDWRHVDPYTHYSSSTRSGIAHVANCWNITSIRTHESPRSVTSDRSFVHIQVGNKVRYTVISRRQLPLFVSFTKLHRVRGKRD